MQALVCVQDVQSRITIGVVVCVEDYQTVDVLCVTAVIVQHKELI